jgi:NAD-dependent dihydropyrimidine dehydrogenase PreA subunit
MNMGYYIVGAFVALWLTGSIYRHIRGLGKTVRIAEENCTGCGKCLKRCRRNVFEMIKDERGTRIIVKNPDNCTACGDCLSGCKFKALEIIERQKNKRL